MLCLETDKMAKLKFSMKQSGILWVLDQSAYIHWKCSYAEYYEDRKNMFMNCKLYKRLKTWTVKSPSVYVFMVMVVPSHVRNECINFSVNIENLL